MASATTKVALSASRDIPFNKLLLSACNVRRVKAGVSIQELADDIARRSLLQSLLVRPVLDADGQETGTYEIPAGGRRYRALELLVKQKRLAKTAPIPCVVRTEGIAEEDSLAENVQRAPLHPLDQFRAFLALRERGQSEEEIAAAFFVSVAVVKQRLRLASVSPRLLDVYAEDGMTLDQLIAFTVSGDHERQEQVWERLQSSYTKEPFMIRRLLTEGAVRASDKRARFIGVDAYEQAGGTVLRDLFEGDDGGWLQDVALVERLVAERLQREADAVRAEGWRWIETAPDFPYGHTFRLRQLRGEAVPRTAEEEAEQEALSDEYVRLEAEYVDEEVPEEVEARLVAIEARIAELDMDAVTFDPAEVGRAGAFLSIDGDGRVRVERGYVRPEDELPVEPEPEPDASVDSADAEADGAEPGAAMPASGGTDGETVYAAPEPAAEEDEGIKPLPDRLLAELTAHRTLALRFAVGGVPHLALLAVLHALCLKLFYRYALDSCVEIDAKSVAFGAQAPGLNDTVLAQALHERQRGLTGMLPKDPADLWDVLNGCDADTLFGLFAHCVALSINAVHDVGVRRPRALAHAERLAEAVRLDMTAHPASWAPTVDNYLGRVTKARIVQAVREGRGEQAAAALDGLKKGEMAERAQELLAGAGWLPEPLRTPGGAAEGSAAEWRWNGSGGPPLAAGAAVTSGTLTPDTGDEHALAPEQPSDPAAADAPAENWSTAAE